MFETAVGKASESSLEILGGALDECFRLSNQWICTEHILLSMTRCTENVAGQALQSMKINHDGVQKQVDEELKDKSGSEPLFRRFPEIAESVGGKPVLKLHGTTTGEDEVGLSKMVVEALRRALDCSLFFGDSEVKPQHLLLGLLDVSDARVNKILEELAINIPFLRRQVMALCAKDTYKQSAVPTLHDALTVGFNELVTRFQEHVHSLHGLAARAGGVPIITPARSQIVHMVCMAYMGEFLSTQVMFQRYLLEENIRSLSTRVGTLDKEITAGIVSSGAQSMRSQVRTTIEYIWCNQYRLLSRMLDEAEHDLIGSVIEDLWWAQSEEIALHDLFEEAMDDHRRKQVLSLQKRRIEISSRLSKLRHRLDDTVKQCFVKHSISA